MFKIYRPVKSSTIGQKFGENLACCKTDIYKNAIRPFQIIAKKNFVCPVGYSSFYEMIDMKGHNGIDITTYRGESVYFNVDADTKWYAKTEVDADGGVGIRVYSLDPLPFKLDELPAQLTSNIMDYYNGNFSHDNSQGQLRVQFLYWHLKDVHLSDKPKIQIGTYSDGRPELAPEIKFGDLIGFANSTGASAGDHLHHSMKFCNKASLTIGADNGYCGAVDMSQFFVNRFVGDIIEIEKQAVTAIKVAKNIIAEVVAYIKSRNLLK